MTYPAVASAVLGRADLGLSWDAFGGAPSCGGVVFLERSDKGANAGVLDAEFAFLTGSFGILNNYKRGVR